MHRVAIIFFFAVAIVGAIAIAVEAVSRADALGQARIERNKRIDALLCWHEFQSGRRATTADCPEL